VKPAVGAAAVEHTGGGSLRHDRRGKSIDEQRSASVSALKADTAGETLAASGPMRGPNHLSPSQTAGGSASTICSTPSPPPSPRRAHSPRFPVLCTVCLFNDDDHGSFSMCVCCGQCFCGECTTLLRRVACCPNCNAEGGTSDKTCVPTPPLATHAKPHATACLTDRMHALLVSMRVLRPEAGPALDVLSPLRATRISCVAWSFFGLSPRSSLCSCTPKCRAFAHPPCSPPWFAQGRRVAGVAEKII
jgi:hypothetical protein